jgi:two-component system chemotaxis response regulator CheY
MRALVLDDSKAVKKAIRSALADAGFTVFGADDSSEALDVLDKVGPVDLILVDWDLPELGGLRFVLGLRAKRKFEDTRLVMLTRQPKTAEILEAIRFGVDECLVKPFTRKKLLDKLAQLRMDPA